MKVDTQNYGTLNIAKHNTLFTLLIADEITQTLINLIESGTVSLRPQWRNLPLHFALMQNEAKNQDLSFLLTHLRFVG